MRRVSVARSQKSHTVGQRADLSKRLLRSAITNGRLLVDVDARSGWMRRLKDLMEYFTITMGGDDNVSAWEEVLIRRAAMLTLQCEFLETRWASDTDGVASGVDLDQYQRASNSLRRLLTTLSPTLQRRAKDVTTLGQLLRADQRGVQP